MAIGRYLDRAIFQGNCIALFQMEALTFGANRTNRRIVTSIGETSKINGQIDIDCIFIVEKANTTANSILQRVTVPVLLSEDTTA